MAPNESKTYEWDKKNSSGAYVSAGSYTIRLGTYSTPIKTIALTPSGKIAGNIPFPLSMGNEWVYLDKNGFISNVHELLPTGRGRVRSHVRWLRAVQTFLVCARDWTYPIHGRRNLGYADPFAPPRQDSRNERQDLSNRGLRDLQRLCFELTGIVESLRVWPPSGEAIARSLDLQNERPALSQAADPRT